MPIKPLRGTILLFLLLFAVPAFADDEILVHDGKTYRGNILFWDDSSYVISIDGHAEHVPISEIVEIRFENGTVSNPGAAGKVTNSD